MHCIRFPRRTFVGVHPSQEGRPAVFLDTSKQCFVLNDGHFMYSFMQQFKCGMIFHVFQLFSGGASFESLL